MDSVVLGACPLCGSSPSGHFRLSGPHNRFGATDTFSRCGGCGTAYANPVQNGYPYDEAYLSRPGGITPRQAYIAYSRVAQIVMQAERIFQADPRSIDLLDVGCGFGDMVGFARHLDFRSAWGIDVNPSLSRRSTACSETPPVLTGPDPFRVWDDRLPDHHPNVVSLYDSLEHVPAPAEVLREICRRADACLLLVVNVPQIPQTDPRVIPITLAQLISIFEREPHPTEHFYLFSDAGVEVVARQCGLRIDSVDRVLESCMRRDGDYTTYYLLRNASAVASSRPV